MVVLCADLFQAARISLLHSLVHIENVAIDLTWDIIARFTHYNLPKEFYDNFVKIAADESKVCTTLCHTVALYQATPLITCSYSIILYLKRD